MAINLDKALGIHEAALRLRAYRTELLASNLANADTPNYKARDIDFKAMLAESQSAQASTLKTTQPGHIGTGEFGPTGEALYRVPSQSSLDGNTVDPQREKAEFMQNALQYQASLQFINGRLRGLRSAIRGD